MTEYKIKKTENGKYKVFQIKEDNQIELSHLFETEEAAISHVHSITPEPALKLNDKKVYQPLGRIQTLFNLSSYESHPDYWKAQGYDVVGNSYGIYLTHSEVEAIKKDKKEKTIKKLIDAK